MRLNFLYLVALMSACGSGAVAGDYILRLDTVVSVDDPADDEQPNKNVVHSIEAIARPQAAFCSKAVLDVKKSLLLEGDMHSTDSDNFTVRFKYVYTVDTGTTYPTKGGKREPYLRGSSIESVVTLAVGEPVSVGSCITKETSATGILITKTVYRLALLPREVRSSDE